ncbi:MAG: signal peptide peptidase SppA [Nanoarchaeota archaeon]
MTQGKFSTIITVIVILYLVSYLTSKFIVEDGISNKIAVIPIEGTIGSSSTKVPFQKIDASSEKIISYIKDANENKYIKGILLDINSPGGTVVASREIAEAVKKSNKPVVAFINEIGTSGAYWIASASDKIISDQLSITGSIGVIAGYLEFSELFEKYGVTYESLKSGKYKDIASPFKKMTEEERNILQKKLDLIHKRFIEAVAENRDLSKNSVEKLATGIYFLGEEAKDLGLIDILGTKELAINITKELANISEASLVEYKEAIGIFDLLSQIGAHSSFYIGKGIGSSLKEIDISKNLEIIS